MLEVVEPPRPARRTPPTQHGSPATGVRCLLTSAHHQPMLIAAQQVLSRTKLKLQWMERQERESQLQRAEYLEICLLVPFERNCGDFLA